MITFAAFVGGLATGVGASIAVTKISAWLRAFDKVFEEMLGIDARRWLRGGR